MDYESEGNIDKKVISTKYCPRDINAIIMYLVIVGGTKDKSIEEIEYEEEAQRKCKN